MDKTIIKNERMPAAIWLREALLMLGVTHQFQARIIDLRLWVDRGESIVKEFVLDGIGCADCGAKIEEKIKLVEVALIAVLMS